MSRFLRFLRMFAVAVVCAFGAHAGAFADCSGTSGETFAVKTTAIGNGQEFRFTIKAKGEFCVDWGDGTYDTYNQSSTSGLAYIHSHAYSGSPTSRVIKIKGNAERYHPADWAWNTCSYDDGYSGACSKQASHGAIMFGNPPSSQREYYNMDGSQCTGSSCVNTPQFVAQIGDGNGNYTSLGKVFKTHTFGGDNVDPGFAYTFAGATNLTSIPEDLFGSKVTSTKPYMFSHTFDGTGITSIPQDLFKYVKKPGVVTGEVAMFLYTFANTNISSIPSGLFVRSKHGISSSLFEGTFSGCTNLTQSGIPYNIFKDFKPDDTSSVFKRTFENIGITTLSDAARISTWFPTSMDGKFHKMYEGTFANNHNLTSISSGLNMFHVDLAASDGWRADGLFKSTFAGCEHLNSIPSDLFGNYRGGGTDGFNQTFSGCSALQSVPGTLFSKVTGSGFGLFYSTFKNSGLTSIPSALFSGLTGTAKDNMFYDTFWGCAGLTSVPANLFKVTSVGDNTFRGTFAFCNNIGNGTSGKVNSSNDPIIQASTLTVNSGKGRLAFASMFEGCSKLTTINANIIRPISGAFSDAMFYRTFARSGLTSVPSAMFATYHKAPQRWLFKETFAGCSNLSTIPNNLFSGMSGELQIGTFDGTFMEDQCDANGANCQNSCGLNMNTSSLGSNFFGMAGGNVSGGPRPYIFRNTFKGCSGLVGEIPDYFFFGLSGVPYPSGTGHYHILDCTSWENFEDRLNNTSSWCTRRTGESLFEGTFQGTGITGTVKALNFYNLYGRAANSIFKNTFKGCTGLTSVGPYLFNSFTEVAAGADSAFEGTFDGCSGLSNDISTLHMFDNLSGSIAENVFKNTFRGCSSLTGGLSERFFGTVSGGSAGSFVGTFQGCSGLTGFVPKPVFANISASAGSNSSVFGGIFDGATNMVINCYDAGYAESTSSDRCHSFETAAAWGNGNPNEIVRCCGEQLDMRTVTYNPGDGALPQTPIEQRVEYEHEFSTYPIGTFTKENNIMSLWNTITGGSFPNPGVTYRMLESGDTVLEPNWTECTCKKGPGVSDCVTRSVTNTTATPPTNVCVADVTCKPGYITPTYNCNGGAACESSCTPAVYEITLNYNGGSPAGGSNYLVSTLYLKYGVGFYTSVANANADTTGANALTNLADITNGANFNTTYKPVNGNDPYQGFYAPYTSSSQQGSSNNRGGVGVSYAEAQIINRSGDFTGSSSTFTTSDATITARYGDPIYTLTFDDAGGYNGSSQVFLRYQSSQVAGQVTPKFYATYEEAFREIDPITRVTIPERPGYSFDGYFLPTDVYSDSKTDRGAESNGYFVPGEFVTGNSVPGPKRIADDITLTAHWTSKFIPVCLDHNGATNASSFHDKVWLEYEVNYHADRNNGVGAVIHYVDQTNDNGSVIPQKTGYVFEGYLGPEQGAIRSGEGGSSSSGNFPLVVNSSGRFIDKSFATDEGNKSCECDKEAEIPCPTFITANYSKEIYEITLDQNGGSGGTPSKVYLWYANDFYSNSTATHQLGGVTAPTREGYTFNGYYYGNCTNGGGLGNCTQILDNYGRVVAGRTTFTQADTTITAQWTPNVYEITVNDNCGANPCQTSGTPTTLYVRYGDGWYRTRANALAGTNSIDAMDTNPARTGYSFEGYTNTRVIGRSGGGNGGGSTNGVTITRVTDNIGRFLTTEFTTEDTTINADWLGACNLISLNPNGGTSGSVNKLFKRTGSTAWYMDDLCSVQYATTADVIPTKQNYRFRGFFSTQVTPDVEANADTTGLTQYIMTDGALSYNGYNLVVSGPTTIYAAWARECNTIDPGTCTLDVTLDGIVTYTLDCPTGWVEHGEGTYNPYCSAGCYPILLDNQTRGGTTANSYLYKFGGGANETKWYSDDECTTEVTTTPAPAKTNATFNGYYYVEVGASEAGGSNTRSSNRTLVGSAASPSVLSDEWTVTGPETIYAYYNCNQNYTNNGVDIAGVCDNSVYEITLDDNGGDNGHGMVYERYNDGYALDRAATVWSLSQLTDLPDYTDYTFRGYYSTQLTPLQANGNTGTLVIKKNGTLPTSPTYFSDDTTVYAAWARNCVSPVSHGNCTLVVSNEGAVEYTTTCDPGYSLTSGSGTYNPVCTLNTYTVTYQLNQGNSSVTPSHTGTHPATYTIEDTFTITDPTMTGYTFTGWEVATAPTAWGSGQTSVSGDTNFTVAVGTYGNIVFRATWTPNTNTAYTVNHYTKNLNDNNYTLNSSDNLTGTSDASVTLSTLATSITGFNYVEGFAGTTTNHPGTTKPSSGAVTSTTILPDGTRVIDLYYDRAQYTITFKTGNSTMATQSCTYGTTVALTQYDNMSIPSGVTIPSTSNGWAFYGWANNYNRKTKDYDDGAQSVSCTDDMTLYGLWRRSVHFLHRPNNSNGLDSSAAQTYYNTDATTAAVDSVNTVALSTNSTYHWAPLGWQICPGNNCGTQNVDVAQTGATTTTVTPAHNIGDINGVRCPALYNRTVTISYDGNGADSGSVSDTTAPQYYTSTSTSAQTLNITLRGNGFTKTGHTFAGWAAGSEYGTVYGEGDTFTFPNTTWTSTDSYTMYATWDLNSYSCPAGYYLNGMTCVLCIGGNYCPGGEWPWNGGVQGLNVCPDPYTQSEAGSSAITDCYRPCTTDDVPNSISVTGNYYYGGYNTCEATYCDTGYHTVEGDPEPGNRLGEGFGGAKAESAPLMLLSKTAGAEEKNKPLYPSLYTSFDGKKVYYAPSSAVIYDGKGNLDLDMLGKFVQTLDPKGVLMNLGSDSASGSGNLTEIFTKLPMCGKEYVAIDSNGAQMKGDLDPELVYKEYGVDVRKEPNAFGVVYPSDSGNVAVAGNAQCSTTTDSVSAFQAANSGMDYTKVSTSSSISSDKGGNCWCRFDQYGPSKGPGQSVNGKWVLIDAEKEQDICDKGGSDNCTLLCADALQNACKGDSISGIAQRAMMNATGGGDPVLTRGVYPQYSNIGRGEWKHIYSDGKTYPTIYGMSACLDEKRGVYETTDWKKLMEKPTSGANCWCRGTHADLLGDGFGTEKGLGKDDIIFDGPATFVSDNFKGVNECNDKCALYCANNMETATALKNLMTGKGKSGSGATALTYCEPNTYNIVYTLNGGTQSAPKPTTATYDEAFQVSNPTHAHGTFAGWTLGGMDTTTHYHGTSSSVGSMTQFSTATLATPTTDTWFLNLTSVDGATVTFTAKWTCATGYTGDDCHPDTYTITFKTGNSTMATQSCTYGTSVTLTSESGMSNDTMTGTHGWAFYGWANNYNRKTKDYDDGQQNVSCTGDMDLYGLWQRNVAFTYYNGASATSTTTSNRTQTYYNTTATATGVDGVDVYTLATQTDYHWEPQGWVLNNTSGTSVETVTNNKLTPAANVDANYYALYKRTATIAYNANGGTGTTANTTGNQLFNAGSSNANTLNLSLAANAFTKTGHTFMRWAAGSTTGTTYAAGASFAFPNKAWTSTDTYTMYALWTPITYNITYTMNGGTPAYTQLEYLQSSGTQYINTGFVPNSDFKHTLVFELTSSANSSKYICGTGVAEGRSGNVRINGNTIDGVYINVGNGAAVSILNATKTLSGQTTLIMDLHGNAQNTMLLNDQSIANTNTGTVTSSKQLQLFALNSSYLPTGVRIYRSVIEQNGTAVHNFVPARRNSDNVLGMYDTVTGVFKTNAGSGTFTAGSDVGPVPSTYTYGIGATVAAGEPTRAHSVFAGWTGSGVTTPAASVTIGTTDTGDKAYTANWTCEPGYASNAAGTACELVNYNMNYTCSDDELGYTYEGTAPTAQTAHYLADAPLSATLPGIGNCQKVYGQGTSDYCANCFNFLGWSVDAEETALGIVEAHTDTIPTWGKTGNTTWCKIAGVNDDWGSTSGACAGFTDSTPFTLRPVYEPKTYTLLYAHAPSTGPDSGNRPGTYVYTYGRDTISAADLSLAHGHFDGWCKDDPDMQNCTGSTETSVGPRDFGDHTFYAKWACDAGYSLSYDANDNPVCSINQYTVTITVGQAAHGISALSGGTGWTGNGTGTITQSFDYDTQIDLTTITPTHKNGYTGVSYSVSGVGTLSGTTFTVGAGDATITVEASGILDPTSVTLTISDTEKTYNKSATTLTAGQSRTYDSAITVYYKFGNTSTFTTGNCPASYSYASTGTTTATKTLGATEYLGKQCHSVKVYASDGSLSSNEVVYSGTARQLNLVKRAVDFHVATGETLNGTATGYAQYNNASLYNGEYGTTTVSAPTASKTGYDFQGWFTASTGGDKVYNATPTLQSGVTNHTNNSSQWILNADTDLYAQFEIKQITCPSTKYLPAGGLSTADCVLCTAGNYCPGGTFPYNPNNAQGINPCTVGSYCPAGVAAPIACVKGSYTDTTGQSVCIACQNGKTTTAAEQTSCNADCANRSGAYSWANATWNSNNTMTDLCTITACSTNYYPVANNSGNSCPLCNSFANGLYPYTDGNTLVSSVASTYNGDGRRACFLYRRQINGYHIAHGGDLSKTACVAGTYSYYAPDSEIKTYFGGYYECDICPIDTYSGSAATQCTDCLSGYITSGAGSTSSSDCRIYCDGGYYLPVANATSCSEVGAGHWAAGHWVPQGQTSSYSNCPNGLTTIGYGVGADEVGDCGRKLHVGNDVLYLRSMQKTTPSLNVLFSNLHLYGNMSTDLPNMSADIDRKLKMSYANDVFSVYDDSADPLLTAPQLRNLVDNGGAIDYGYTNFNGSSNNGEGYDYGEWFVEFGTGKKAAASSTIVRGTSTCSAFDPKTKEYVSPSNQSDIQKDYLANLGLKPGDKPMGSFCYCRVTNADSPDVQWTYTTMHYNGDPLECGGGCANTCSKLTSDPSTFKFREVLFRLGNVDAKRLSAADLEAIIKSEKNGDGHTYKYMTIDKVVSEGKVLTEADNYGDWGVAFEYNDDAVQINGASVCSSVETKEAYTSPDDEGTVELEYQRFIKVAPKVNITGSNCYCRVTDPNIAGMPWIFMGQEKNCAEDCPKLCGMEVRDKQEARKVILRPHPTVAPGLSESDLNALLKEKAAGYTGTNLVAGAIQTVGDVVSESKNYSDWGVAFEYNGKLTQLNGVSAISTLSSGDNMPASDPTIIDKDYAKQMKAAPTEPDIKEGYCYCKLTDPSISGLTWVQFDGAQSGSDWARVCAWKCADHVAGISEARAAVFTVHNNNGTSGLSQDDLFNLIGGKGIGNTWKRLSDGEVLYGGSIVSPASNYGDFGTAFEYNKKNVQVNGISVCSGVTGDAYARPSDSKAIQTIEQDYAKNMQMAPTEEVPGGNCWCRVTDPNISGLPWIRSQLDNNSKICPEGCANNCGEILAQDGKLQAAMFSPVNASGITAADLEKLVDSVGITAKSLDGDISGDGNILTMAANYGDWGVAYDYNKNTVQVNGISACSTYAVWNGYTDDSGKVQSDYQSNMSAAPTSNPAGGYCWCKLTDPVAPNTKWTQIKGMGSTKECSDGCAYQCATYIATDTYRDMIFGLKN